MSPRPMMLCSFVAVVLLAACSFVDAKAGSLGQRQSDSDTCLDDSVLQTASSFTGQEAGAPGIAAGQSPSDTDDANFINFCSGTTITNGSQVQAGSCNSIPMGKIPASTNMISAMIAYPLSGATIPANKTFNVTVRTTHLSSGYFVNPTGNYYSAPQDLDENGDIVGHCHVTIQNIGSLDSVVPPDPTKPVFFKGINDKGDGKGLLQALVSGGLPPGAYRVCTMIAARNHQPVMMPVAKRGAQDDCNKFIVKG
ncbi:hypothetical protein G7Y89_g2321 [Cudoniella acicularis]|uniref:Uncharacterized protein n=1 Tax=Cudoniella acicularis TaxID=354080 RepID=A0A8H4W8R1_9HELO|nr:hypothetical protein G7Y89_g2321 [Cudoniella acicularis]